MGGGNLFEGGDLKKNGLGNSDVYLIKQVTLDSVLVIIINLFKNITWNK